MFWARLRSLGVFVGLCFLAVVLAPLMILCFFFYLMGLAFWPERQPKKVSVFHGYEGWHV